MTEGSLAGKHNFLTLQPQALDPTTSATQIALYNKIVSSVPQMFYAPSSAQTPIQMTYQSIHTGVQTAGPPATYFVQQYTFVAGPFVIYGGKITNPTNGVTVTLTPTTTLKYVGLIVANPSTNLPPTKVDAATPINITGSSFDIVYHNLIAGTIDVYYFAIGQP